MPTNADLIAQIKRAINPEMLLTERMRDEITCREKELEQARETLRLQEERVERLRKVLKVAQELAH